MKKIVCLAAALVVVLAISGPVMAGGKKGGRLHGKGKGGGRPVPSALPEPGTLALWGLAGMGLMAATRRRSDNS